VNMMVGMGHNEEAALRLDAQDAQHGLQIVSEGGALTEKGWLIYGAALNSGRARFEKNPRGDDAFGAWVVASQLGSLDGDPIKYDYRSSAMWAAGFPEQFAEMKEANNGVRSVRGFHAKWLEAKSARDLQARNDEREARGLPTEKEELDEQRESIFEAVDQEQRRSTIGGESRKNNNRQSDEGTDRVNKFAGLCRSLAEFSDDVEKIASWDRISFTAENLPNHVRVALGILNRFMEAKDDL